MFARRPDYETLEDVDRELGALGVEVVETDDEADRISRAYDTDRSGIIDRPEALAAVFDYFGDLITKEEVLEVVHQ